MTMDAALQQRLDGLVERAQQDFKEGSLPVVTAADLLRATDDDAAVQAGIDTAEVLLGLGLDPEALAAALVHELHREGLQDAETLAERLSPAVAGLSEGVLRLDEIRWSQIESEAAESLRKMFLSMASDLRVVLIALAARVHAVRRLKELPEDERQRRAAETMEVYAPLANRLGIWQLKWELEDLAFKFLQPDTFQEIKALLAQKRNARTEAIERVKRELTQKLAEAGINGKVTGRPKHMYSIYKKMTRKGISFEQVYDVAATRVIVDDVAACYAALGIVHGAWTPIDGEFDDYIAKPKENFYRSLHTAVIGPDGKPLEIQIRTQEMHDYNEFGVAAHWRYKESKKADRRFDEKINWLRQIMEWQKDVTDPHEVAQSLKTDIFADQVYVFTPGGDVIDLPSGATPVDFAYRIHTQVGHRCRGARVNGQMVTLDRPLQTGDRVEIITSKQGGPSRDWLNPHLGQVQTSGAKQKIRQYFRLQERDQSIAMGRDTVERELKRLGLDPKHLDVLSSLYPQYGGVEDVLAAIGFGDISSQSVGARLWELERERTKKDEPVLPPAEAEPAKPSTTSVSMAGVEDVMSSPAGCCRPVPGDEVVGFITRGRGVVIHRRDCPNYLNHPEKERWMELSWGQKKGETYPVQLQIIALDRPGLLRDIAEVVALEGVNMTSTAARGSDADENAIVDTTVQIRNSEQLGRVLAKLERLRNVLSARRIRS
jgi:GTP pyrophosphokinase